MRPFGITEFFPWYCLFHFWLFFVVCLNKQTSKNTAVFPSSSPPGTRFARRNVCNSGQKFHIDDINQCLHNKSGSQGIPNVNLFDFMFLVVDYGKVLWSFANELQETSDAFSIDRFVID